MGISSTSPQFSLDRVFEDPSHYLVPPGVIRYDHYHTHGWWARMQRDGESLRTFFSDGQYGSIEDALRAAIKHQQELIDAFGTSFNAGGKKQLPTNPEDRISRKVEKPKGNGVPYESWVARWYDQQYKVQTKRFAVRLHGEEKAKALALATTTANHNSAPRPIRYADSLQRFKWKPYPRADVLRASKVNTEPNPTKSFVNPPLSDAFAFEGDRKFVLHQQIERDKKLRDAKIRDFVERHGRVFCEICSFSFSDTYSFLADDIIQVHHQTPLGLLDKSTRTTLNDLMLICANCHFAIHQGDAVENVIAALDIFKGER
jgi:predicted HNH restriction endonuclease